MKNIKLILYISSIVTINCFVTASTETTPTKLENVDKQHFQNEFQGIELSPETFKKLMWKKCSNSSYVTCAKLAFVHVIEKLDSSESYILLPGISLLKREDTKLDNQNEEVVIRKDFNEALDKYLLKKIRKYLGSLTLSVKLLDKNTIEDMRAFGDVLVNPNGDAEGRGKKKYMHSLLMAGWMSGATLLALTMKTIAVLSGKALLAALLSLLLSLISLFSHKGHGDLKSTTYEIITKPIVAHSHAGDIHEGPPGEMNSVYPYKRSINPELILKGANMPDEIENIIKKIRERTPYYSPVSVEYSKP